MCRMVVAFLVQVEVGVGGFSVYSVSEGAVHSPVYVNIQKWEVSIFCFHGELYVVVNSIKMVEKFR